MKYPRPVYGMEGAGGAGAPAGSGGPTDGAAAVGEGGAAAQPTGAAPSWRDGLSDELKQNPGLADVTDVGALAQQFVEQQAYLGNALRIPGPDAGAEDRVAFHQRVLEKVPGLMPKPDSTDEVAMNGLYDAMGRPAAAADYQRPTGENMPVLDDDLDKAYADSAHKNGLSQSQYHNVMADFLTAQQAMSDGVEKDNAEGLTALKQEWGYTYDQRIEASVNAMQRAGFPDELVGMAKEGKLGPGVMKSFYWFVEALGGDGAEIGQQPGGGQTGMTPNEADLQIAEIMKRPEYTHHDMNVRKPLMDKVQELMKFAVPGKVDGTERHR